MQQLARFLAALLAILFTQAGYAASAQDDMRSLWESLWTQTGYPLPLSRWEVPAGSVLNFRFSGYDVKQQAQGALVAVSDVTSAAGLAFADVTANHDAEKTAHISIEFLSPLTTNTELADRLACAAFPTRNDRSGRLEKVRILVKHGRAHTCMHHELMHAMGVPGHPSGKSILSYFPWRQDQISELDKKMLKAWYSPKVRSGMRVLEAIGPLTLEIANQQPPQPEENRAEAQSTRTGFLREIVQEMESFAAGHGEIPTIIRRSGMTSSNAIELARSEIAVNLGVTYQSGAMVAADLTRAIEWYELAARQRHVMAHVFLFFLYSQHPSQVNDPVKAYQWLTLLAKLVDTPQIKEALDKQQALLSPAQIQEAQELVARFSYQTPS